ncbi:MAG: hypothetical protein ACOZDY_18985 [Pseudomonadota bacterium]
MNALHYLAQALLYLPFMAFIGYFSNQPTYHPLGPDEALLRVSIRHAGERKEECRERSPEELAKLSPNMRAPTVCPRERVPITVELEIDGEVVFHQVAPPSGFARDLASTVHWRRPVPAGKHRIVARLNDVPREGFNHVHEADIDLAPGAALVIDFQADRGGFLLRP